MEGSENTEMGGKKPTLQISSDLSLLSEDPILDYSKCSFTGVQSTLVLNNLHGALSSPF